MFMIHLTVQLFSMYYLLTCHLGNVGMQTTSMIFFFKRSGAYNLDCFGRFWNKINVKTPKQIWEYVLMQASNFVINYLNTNIFFVALFTFCDTFCAL